MTNGRHHHRAGRAAIDDGVFARMHISPARPADLPDIVELVNSAYRGDSAREGWTHEADLLDGQRTDVDSLRRELGGAHPATILCLREGADGPIAACVFIERMADGNSGAKCHLGMLTVRPARQSRGLGRAVLAAAERQARDWGAVAVEMTVIHSRDTLIAYYERRGYRRTGESRPFPSDDPRFGRPTCDDLHFVVLEKQL
jgi:ribosomal protein S18 acetylase RimI-like enzyme